MTAKSVSPTSVTIISPACSARRNAVRWPPAVTAESPIKAETGGFCGPCRRGPHVRSRIASGDRAYWWATGGILKPARQLHSVSFGGQSARANIGSLASRASQGALGRRRESENHPWVASCCLHSLVGDRATHRRGPHRAQHRHVPEHGSKRAVPLLRDRLRLGCRDEAGSEYRYGTGQG